MTDLFLIHGLKYSGKSTLAERLMERYGYVRVKLADPLKNMVRSLLRDAGIASDMIERYVEGDLKEAAIAELGGTSSRRLMMTLGDEWRNMHGHMLWANIAASKVEKLLSEGKKVVVDDVRYPFELERMTAFSPFTCAITRGTMHFEPYGEDRHPGERPMPVSRFDFHFRNDFATKDELWDVLDLVLEANGDYRRRLGEISELQGGQKASENAVPEPHVLAGSQVFRPGVGG
jgi:hypothetical protein